MLGIQTQGARTPPVSPGRYEFMVRVLSDLHEWIMTSPTQYDLCMMRRSSRDVGRGEDHGHGG